MFAIRCVAPGSVQKIWSWTMGGRRVLKFVGCLYYDIRVQFGFATALAIDMSLAMSCVPRARDVF